MALVTYTQAKAHLGIGDEHESTVRLQLEQATQLVLLYLGRPEQDWTEDTDPTEDPDFSIVQAAILAQLGDLFRFRGDDDDDPADKVEDANYLSARVRRMLYPLRSPSLA